MSSGVGFPRESLMGEREGSQSWAAGSNEGEECLIVRGRISSFVGESRRWGVNLEKMGLIV